MASNGVVLEDAVDALGEDMSATDEDSDTRRLLGEQAASYNYGSSTSDGRERSRKTNKTHSSPWSQPFSHLLSLAQSWKRRKMIPRNRRIDINSGLPPSASFCSNRVSTTKYNPLTFFPYFLFDQFRRYANLFFLAIGLLQQIPGISPTGKFTTLFPLGLVLLATAAKEIIEDVKRFRADNQVNRRKVYVLRADKWHRVRWTQVKVGDIVRVENKQFFPADLLFLSSSDPLGLCYVETSNLDGETNLKIRQAHPDTLKVSQVETLQGYLECEGPNNRLYEFNGNLSIAAKRPVPIQPDNVLLRGSLLRNTQWVHGLVVYTGPDSKLQQNGTETRLKRSAMDNATNRQVIFMFLVLLVLAVVSSLGYSIWTSLWADKMWYLYMANESASKMAANFFYSILTFIILYNNLIPISLIITVEVVKLIQAYLINFDLDMYDESTDTPALARNSNLNEELGQVKFVFSDKTGTLTENIMEFKQCSVSGIVYSTDSSEEGDDSPPLVLREALKGSGRKAMLHFFRVLALCHTVIPEWVEDSQSLVYRASSPDEEALVKAARDLGVVFKARTPKSIIIEVDGAEEEYELLNLLEFNSTRKRMSVVVRFPDGSIRVLCKGADTVIYSRLAPSEDFSSSTNSHLKTFAVTGLRTLCVAERTIGLVDYEEWEKVYYAASTHLVKEEKEKKLDEAAELIEQQLHLLGATAIEDKLQKDVPETIATLREANMKVWVLTGDKLETAVNIGYASKQLVGGMDIMTISDQATITDVQRKVSEFCGRMDRGTTERHAALVIDGKSLSFALDSTVEKDFLNLALSCKSVICCRVSPLQKAEVVTLVRTNVKDSITLAIGDGANDVSMIQAAHIGVGISGREGLQATLASDYAISQFRFLAKLLLVHGAWNYRRLANVILYSFYKNICLYMIEFWFSFLNGFSGQPLFERWTIGLYNILFTLLAPIALGILDQDVSASTRLAQPHLYKTSQQNSAFNTKMFWKWVFLSLFHSAVLFYAVYFLLWHETPFENGQVFGIWYVGNTVYTAVVVTVNVKAAMVTQYWTPLTHVAIWGSIAAWFLYVLVYSHFWPTFPLAVEFVGQDFKLFTSFTFYGLFVLAPAVASLPEFMYIVFQKTLCPTSVDRAIVADVEGRGGKMIERDREMGLSVSYSVSSGSSSYGDGMDQGEAERALTYKHGYAFSQEDHGSLMKGTFVQRRDLVRFYDTQKGHTH